MGETTRAPLQTKDYETFGSFFLGESEFVMNVSFIQEVVNAPKALFPMPLAPDFLLGLFHLRGMIIPVVSLRVLLKFGEEVFSESQKIAVIDYQGAKIGFLVDATGEVLRIHRSEMKEFSCQNRAASSVVKGAIQRNGGRLLQILDPTGLMSVENIPQILRQQNASSTSRSTIATGERKKCISFTVAGMQMAFEITGIQEIVKVPTIQKSVLGSDLCLGIIGIRDRVIPVVDTARLLKNGAYTFEVEAAENVIILQLQQNLVGLLVDSVDSIEFYYVNEILPLPVLTKERVDIFQGCISAGPSKEIILLDHEKLLSSEEIAHITHGHSTLYKSKPKAEAPKDRARSARESYISFKLDHCFGVSVLDVKEILDASQNVIETPGMPAHMKGLLNLRGELLSVIDMRSLYGFPTVKMTEETKILVFQSQNEKFGLLIDALEEILTVSDSNSIPLPTLLYGNGIGETLKNDIKKVIQMKGSDAKNSLIILNPEALVARISGAHESIAESRAPEEGHGVM